LHNYFCNRLVLCKRLHIFAERKRKRKQNGNFRTEKMEGIMQTEKVTPQTLAESLGLGKDAIRKRWNGIWPGRKFSASAELTETEVQQLSASGSAGNSVSVTKRKSAERKSIEIPQETRTETVPETITETITEKENKSESVDSLQMQAGQKVASSASVRSLIGLYFLLTASTAASVYNMLCIMTEIADIKSAVILTVVFSVAAVVFVSNGLKSGFSKVIVGFLIAYEAVCNCVRIYGGLTMWEKELPTSFLRLVTGMFYTGTFETATLIGAVTAALIAGVQYASVFEINRLKNGKV